MISRRDILDENSKVTSHEKGSCIAIFFNSFIYSHVRTLFGSLFSPALNIQPLPYSPSLPGRTCSALISNFVEEKI
jgi:hypothetical protein